MENKHKEHIEHFVGFGRFYDRTNWNKPVVKIEYSPKIKYYYNSGISKARKDGFTNCFNLYRFHFNDGSIIEGTAANDNSGHSTGPMDYDLIKPLKVIFEGTI